MTLEIWCDGRAGRTPITVWDTLRVRPVDTRGGRECLVKFVGEGKYVLAGTVARMDARLPAGTFEARVVSGNGHTVKIAMVHPYRTCEHCKRHLQAVGFARANGKNHRDWDTRCYHKTCLKHLCRDLPTTPNPGMIAQRRPGCAHLVQMGLFSV
jgi:hypothetical protein